VNSPDKPVHDSASGILAICAAMACFIVSDVFSKLVMARLPVGETIALRGILSVAIFAIPVALDGTIGLIWQRMSGLWAARIGSEMVGAASFITAISMLPIANVVAISQTSPLFMTAIAALFLGEIVGWRRWAATVAGFLGMLLIVKPGSGAFAWWSILPLCTMASIIVRDIATRRMDKAIPATLITFSTAVGVMLSGFGIGLVEAQWLLPRADEWFYLLAAAGFVATAYYFSIQAVRRAELSVVAPFRYVILPLSLMAGWVVWGEVPDVYAILGIAVIAIAGAYTFLRERVAKTASPS
jgi:drug/metabolite transporter (DMT)-like permease